MTRRRRARRHFAETEVVADAPQGFETLALHAGPGRPTRPPTSRAVPIYQTTSYVFDDADHAARLFGLQEFGNIYTRIMNPTTDVLEKRIAALEGGVGALAFASGQAARDAGHPQHRQRRRRDRLHHQPLRRHLQPLPLHPAQAGDHGQLRRAERRRRRARRSPPKTKAVYSETIGNPDLLTLDIAGRRRGRPRRRRAADPRQHAAHARTWCGRFEHGADIVVHSATKFIGGHGTSHRRHHRRRRHVRLEGVGPLPRLHRARPELPRPGLHRRLQRGQLRRQHRLHHQDCASSSCATSGPSMSPFNAFLFLQGVETLPLRMERHSQNAMAVARFLSEHPKVTWVNYPGLPGHPAYETRHASTTATASSARSSASASRAGCEAGRRFIENVKLFSHLANVGDAKSLVIHPATTTHSQLDRERAGRDRRHAGLRPPLGRPGNGRRPHRRPRAGARHGIGRGEVIG